LEGHTQLILFAQRAQRMDFRCALNLSGVTVTILVLRSVLSVFLMIPHKVFLLGYCFDKLSNRVY
ncbi:hypothetical protein CD126_11925, partial [Staphylococcus pettenkoferi]